MSKNEQPPPYGGDQPQPPQPSYGGQAAPYGNSQPAPYGGQSSYQYDNPAGAYGGQQPYQNQQYPNQQMPQQGGYYEGPKMGYYNQQQGPYPPQGQYGPPQGPYQGPYQGGYQQQGYFPGQQDRGRGGTGAGIAGGLLAGLACCCCVDLCLF